MAQAGAMQEHTFFPLILLLSGACFADSPDWQARMQEANRLDRAGRYSQAQILYLAALEEAEKSGSVDSRLGESLNNLGAHYFYCGKYAEAEPLYRRALEVWKTARPEDA